MTRPFHLMIAGLLAALVAPLAAYDVPGYSPDQIIPFKQTANSSGGPVTLNLHVFTPAGHKAGHQRPAVVFFFGGGWTSGSASHFHPQCEFLASRGMVAISAEYRVRNEHGTSPQECVRDAKSAIRYVRQHAAALGVDPSRIAAGGGSAGGHLAAAAATLTGYEEPGENLTIPSKPDALVLYNPVVDNGPGGYGHATVQAYWQSISPLHNLDASAPPTTFFLGTSDALVPVSVGLAYQSAMRAAGRRCDLHLYQGQPHSFFNFDVPDDDSGPFHGYRDTVFKTDAFFVSLGWLAGPHADPRPLGGWRTIFGDAGFTGDSAATASPVTTDANGDAIAAGFERVELADGEFVRLDGSVTFNGPLAGNAFRIGLFDGPGPVTPGVGGGYTGIWAGAPSTTAATLAAGGGGGGQPFETAASTVLGPIPAAATALPADASLEFSLIVARNGSTLDVSARFSDGGSYEASQNLLNLALANRAFDRAAVWMNDASGATRARFSDLRTSRGVVLPSAGTNAVPPPAAGAITYVDAVAGDAGNTFKTGGAAGDTTWVGPDSASVNNTQWNQRGATSEGNGDTIFQGLLNTNTLPELTTRITGLADGSYQIWAFYWDQVESATQNWVLSAGLSSGALTTYSSPGHPNVAGTTKAGVSNAAGLVFSNPVKVEAMWNGTQYLRNLFGINLGRVTVSGGAPVQVFIDHSLTSGSNNRAWYDGVGYQPVSGGGDAGSRTRLFGVDFNRGDALGSPSQSGFRVISGSASNPAENAATYAKTIGPITVTVSRPDGDPFEFRGANGDPARAIPGGDTSHSFLVSDFIATDQGTINLRIDGLPAGDYGFRSWHLDTLTTDTLGFAQGAIATQPNLIEAQVGGVTLAAVEPTSLGAAGLNTTFISNPQMPTLEFRVRHDGGSTLTIRLRAIDSNGSARHLLLNGFEISQTTP